MEKEAESIKKYVFWAALILLVILAYYTIKSYLISLASAFILAYIAKPVYLYLEKKIGKSLAAALSILLLIIIVVAPVLVIVNDLYKQDYSDINQGNLNTFLTSLSSKPIFKSLHIDFKALFQKGVDLIISVIPSGISYLPSVFLNLLIMIMGIFIILTNWNAITSHLERYIPVKNKEAAAKELSRLSRAIIYGTIFISFLEAVVAAIGFTLIGIKLSLILSIIVFFLALIGIGPGVVIVLSAIYYLLIGNYATMIWVIVIGFLLSIVIDIILRNKIIGEKAKMNSFVMLLGIIGGLSAFGILGFILGPIILFYTIQIIDKGAGES